LKNLCSPELGTAQGWQYAKKFKYYQIVLLPNIWLAMKVLGSIFNGKYFSTVVGLPARNRS
jgi:hypothetical protein